MRNRTLATSVVAVLAAAIAGCGSSKAPGVQPAPSAGLTQASIPTTPTPPPALSKKPVVTVPTGPPPAQLVTKDLVSGSGKAAQVGSSITVNYVGVLYNNRREFDSSWKHGQPTTLPLTPGSVIPGWVSGISGMKVGGRRELIIPPNLGYGKGGRPPTIPPNSTLVFVVDLLSVA
jgi:peptidylprolyl isomerase